MVTRWSFAENCEVDLDLYEYSNYAGDEDEEAEMQPNKAQKVDGMDRVPESKCEVQDFVVKGDNRNIVDDSQNH